MDRRQHLPRCPRYHSSALGVTCTCQSLEDEMVANASIKSPAELLREAQSRGWIEKAFAYQF